MPSARARHGCRTRRAATALRGHAERTPRESARPPARRPRRARSPATRSRPARPSSQPRASAHPRSTPARAGRSSLVLGEPREDRLAREPPLLSDLARRDLLPLGHGDDRLFLDLEQPRELRRGQDLELLRGPEPAAAAAHLALRTAEP